MGEQRTGRSVIIALLITTIVIFVLFCWQQSKNNELQYEIEEQKATLHRKDGEISDLRFKYSKQSRDVSNLVVAITPLIEQTDWLGPQPYGTGLATLQAKERERNRQIVA